MSALVSPAGAGAGAGSGMSASDRAYEVLVRAIATCELRAGEAVVEREEAARLGMSRTPFRDALNRLAMDGLVSRMPKRGTFVSLLDPKDISDNMAVREAIEVEMARHVINADGFHGVDVEALIARQRRAIATGDHREFLAADEEFHMALVAAAGNARAVEAARRAWLHVNRARYLVPMTPTAMRRALGDHIDITVAMHERAIDRSQLAIRNHLEEPLDRLLRAHAQRFPASFSTEALAELSERGVRAHREGDRSGAQRPLQLHGRRVSPAGEQPRAAPEAAR